MSDNRTYLLLFKCLSSLQLGTWPVRFEVKISQILPQDLKGVKVDRMLKIDNDRGVSPPWLLPQPLGVRLGGKWRCDAQHDTIIMFSCSALL